MMEKDNKYMSQLQANKENQKSTRNYGSYGNLMK